MAFLNKSHAFRHSGNMLGALSRDSWLGFLQYFPVDSLPEGMDIPMLTEGLRKIDTPSYTPLDPAINEDLVINHSQFNKSFQEEHENVPNLKVGNQMHKEAHIDVDSELANKVGIQVQKKPDLVKGQWTSEEDRFKFFSF